MHERVQRTGAGWPATAEGAMAHRQGAPTGPMGIMRHRRTCRTSSVGPTNRLSPGTTPTTRRADWLTHSRSVCRRSASAGSTPVGGARGSTAHCGRHPADIDDPDGETIVPIVFGPTPLPSVPPRVVLAGEVNQIDDGPEIHLTPKQDGRLNMPCSSPGHSSGIAVPGGCPTGWPSGERPQSHSTGPGAHLRHCPPSQRGDQAEILPWLSADRRRRAGLARPHDWPKSWDSTMICAAPRHE